MRAPRRRRGRSLLLIHGGGFFGGDPSYMDYAAAIAAQQGEFETLQPDYPLDDLPAAFTADEDPGADRCAARATRFRLRRLGGRRDRRLARLARLRASPPRPSRRRPRCAPGAPLRPPLRHRPARRRPLLGPPAATEEDLGAYSSAARPSLRPLLIFQSCEDRIVPCAMNIGFAARDPRSPWSRIWGAHADPAAKAWSFRHGLAWLAAHAGSSAAAPSAVPFPRRTRKRNSSKVRGPSIRPGRRSRPWTADSKLSRTHAMTRLARRWIGTRDPRA